MPKTPTGKGFFFFFFGGRVAATTPLPRSALWKEGQEGRLTYLDEWHSHLLSWARTALAYPLTTSHPQNTTEFIKEMPSYASRLVTSCPRPLVLGWARLRKPGEGLPFTLFNFSSKNR